MNTSAGEALTFHEARRQYDRLRAAYLAEKISAAEFQAAVDRILVVDENGQMWQIGVSSGKWYRYDAGQWVEAAPEALPPRPPETLDEEQLKQQPPPPEMLANLTPARPTLKFRKVYLWILVPLALLVGFACWLLVLGAAGTAGMVAYIWRDAPTVTFTPTNTVTPSVSPTPTRTHTPTRLPSLTATITTTPTQTKTPRPTPLPSQEPTTAPNLMLRAPEGPWLLMKTSRGLYALAPDGTELTLITNETIVSPNAIQSAIAPAGGRIAYITEDKESRVYGLTLHIVRLPDLVEEQRIALILSEAEGNTSRRSPEAVRAISEQNSLAWSSDGKSLAFIALMDAPSADVYVFSLETGETTRISEDINQEFYPQWSPNGSHVVYFTALAFGDGESLTMRGAYAAPPFENSGRVTLYSAATKGERLAGWATPREALFYSRNPDCGGYNLRRINVETALSTSLTGGCFNDIAVDPGSGNVMLTVDEDLKEACSCASQPLTAGMYFIPGSMGLPRSLSTEETVDVLWHPEARLFYITTYDEDLLAITPEQASFNIPENVAGMLPEISPVSGVWAWSSAEAGSQAGIWVGTRTSAPRQIFDRPASFPRWGTQGRRLLFTSGLSLYVADEPEFVPFPLTTLPGTLLEAAWIVK